MANFDRLKPGMNRAEVNALLGRAASWNDGAAVEAEPGLDPTETSPPGRGRMFEPGRVGTWLNDGLIVGVGFDENGAVCWKRPIVAAPSWTLEERVRYRLQRVWP
jgi:hypothetical protein